MRKLSAPVVILIMLLSLASCKSADKNAGNIASDYCNCFSELEKNMSSDTKKILSRAGDAADPTKSLQADVIALGEEKGKQVAEEMESLGELEDDNSVIGRCIKGVEKKHNNAYSFNEEKTARKIIIELENKPGCSFTASLMKVGLKVKDKPEMQ